MGLFRKMASASTLGAIDFKSDRERTATYSKRAAKEAKKQTKLMRGQAMQARLTEVAQQRYGAPSYTAPTDHQGPTAPQNFPSSAPGYYVAPPSQRRPSPAAPPPPAEPESVLLTQLAKLADMKQAGLLTDDEFAAAKAKLLA